MRFINSGEIELERVFVKDLSLEAPLLPEPMNPAVAYELQTEFALQYRDMDHGRVGCILNLEITCGIFDRPEADNELHYLAAIQQGGIFRFNARDAEHRHELIHRGGAALLYPHAIGLIADMTERAGLLRPHLKAIDFTRINVPAFEL